MRQKYSEIINKEEEKEIMEKIMKEYEEKLRKEKEMGIPLPSEIKNIYENMLDEEFDKELEEIERRYQESIKCSTIVMIMR